MSTARKPEFETFIGVRPSAEMLAKIESVIEEYCSKELEKVVRRIITEKLKEIVRECLEEKDRDEGQIIKLKRIPKRVAIARIKAYINKHQGCRTSDIIYNLGLNPDLVLSTLKELKEKGKIRSEDL